MRKGPDHILKKRVNIVVFAVAKPDSKCYFCDENEDHIDQLLKKKGYCIQCLFLGVYWDKGKHSDSKCHREFVCKHQSHEKYPIKKHCHEHRNNAENQLLQE